MNFSKPIAIVLLAVLIGFIVFPQSSADTVVQIKESVAEFARNLG